MKLIIQIPCFNEVESLGVTLDGLPRNVPGFDIVEWLIIDDGSSDGTGDLAREKGADHIVRHTRNRGLARAFITGIHEAVRLGADVIVNTDADNQYNADDIPLLVAPILEGRADMVIGARPIDSIKHFSPIKKALQKLGSKVVRSVSSTDIADAASGFRAMGIDVVQHLTVFNNYTYTIETIIQAGQKNFGIISVPIRVNDDLRPSRLVRSTRSYIKQSIMTIVRIFVIYRPFRFFGTFALLSVTIGSIIGFRFLYFYINGQGGGHIQSLILSAILLLLGVQAGFVAFLADLLSANRRLLEELRYSFRSYITDTSKQPQQTKKREE